MAEAAHSADVTQSNEGQHITVNNLHFYYEVYGTGRPLVMLHGGLGSIGEFGRLPSLLGRQRQVIAIELHGHGRTSMPGHALSYKAMADDVAGVLCALGLDNADLLGFSLGGSIALRMAIQHPHLVRRLVLISTPAAQAALLPYFREGMVSLTAQAAGSMLDTPMYQQYRSIAREIEGWPALVGQAGELLRQDYDWSRDIAALSTPLLCLLGDSDMIPVSHIAETFGVLPNTHIVVLPHTTHFTILSHTGALDTAISAFLEQPDEHTLAVFHTGAE